MSNYQRRNISVPVDLDLVVESAVEKRVGAKYSPTYAFYAMLGVKYLQEKGEDPTDYGQLGTSGERDEVTMKFVEGDGVSLESLMRSDLMQGAKIGLEGILDSYIKQGQDILYLVKTAKKDERDRVERLRIDRKDVRIEKSKDTGIEERSVYYYVRKKTKRKMYEPRALSLRSLELNMVDSHLIPYSIEGLEKFINRYTVNIGKKASEKEFKKEFEVPKLSKSVYSNPDRFGEEVARINKIRKEELEKERVEVSTVKDVSNQEDFIGDVLKGVGNLFTKGVGKGVGKVKDKLDKSNKKREDEMNEYYQD